MEKRKKEANKKKRAEEKLKNKREKKETKEKKRKDIKNRIKKLWLEFTKKLKITFLSALKIVLACVAVLVLLYTVFAVVLLKFNYDNNSTRAIAKYFIVPAIITKNGIIEYYVYKDIRDNILMNNNSEDKDSLKRATVEMVVYSDLVRKYSLTVPGGNIYDEELREEITKRLVLDNDINQVGINRIKKIKDMIDKGSDFVKTSNKYGDAQDLITISKQNENQISYSQNVKDLSVNEISNVVYTPEGYYIFRCYDKTNDQIALSYVFVKAKSLDQYIEETIKGYKLWSLVE